MIEVIKLIGIYGIMIVGIWVSSIYISNKVSDYELVKPVDDVECIVVSRMFNTSVDCWSTK